MFNIQNIRRKGIGLSNVISITLDKILKTVSAFVDDTILWANG